jgi:hypothetical protein
MCEISSKSPALTIPPEGLETRDPVKSAIPDFHQGCSDFNKRLLATLNDVFEVLESICICLSQSIEDGPGFLRPIFHVTIKLRDIFAWLSYGLCEALWCVVGFHVDEWPYQADPPTVVACAVAKSMPLALIKFSMASRLKK